MLETTRRMSGFDGFTTSQMLRLRSSIPPISRLRSESPMTQFLLNMPSIATLPPPLLMSDRKISTRDKESIGVDVNATSDLNFLTSSVLHPSASILSSNSSTNLSTNSGMNWLSAHLSRPTPMPSMSSSASASSSSISRLCIPMSKTFSPLPLLMNKSSPFSTHFRSSYNIPHSSNVARGKFPSKSSLNTGIERRRSNETSNVYQNQSPDLFAHHRSPSPTDGE